MSTKFGRINFPPEGAVATKVYPIRKWKILVCPKNRSLPRNGVVLNSEFENSSTSVKNQHQTH